MSASYENWLSWAAGCFRRKESTAQDHRAAVDVLDLRAELTASESLVTALQEQMSRLAEQHAKAVTEAREEQREAVAQFITDELNDKTASTWFATKARRTPLDSTPLSARIAELEADMRAVSEENERGHRLIDAADMEPPRTSSMDTLATRVESLLLQRSDLKAALAAEVERHQATAKTLESFTQGIGNLLAATVGGLDHAKPDELVASMARELLALRRERDSAVTQQEILRARVSDMGADLASLPAGPRVVR